MPHRPIAQATRRAAFIVAVALAALPAPVAALERCVQTLADLVDGLHQAQSLQSGGTVTLRLVAQTYAWSGSETIVLANRLNLLGGYNGDCSARTVDPANTVIDGLGALQLELYQAGLGLTVEGVRFHATEVLRVTAPGSCLAYGEEVNWRRTIVDTAYGDFRVDNACGDLVFQNNLLRVRYGTVLALSPHALAADAYVDNNTFLDATQGGALALHRWSESETATFEISNNIMWGSSGTDFSLYPTSGVPIVRAYHNIWGGIAVPLATNVGNLQVDPALDASGRPIEPSSPAINSGYDTPAGGLPAVDIDGGPRRIGSAVDRGAYESSVVDVTELVVTHAGDSGSGSLRQAILDANSLPNFNTIRFAIPGNTGAILIAQSPYPDIVTPMRIDGFTQSGAQPNASAWSNDATYMIQIAGAGGQVSHAFRVPPGAPAGTKLELRGLSIGGFDDAVLLQAGSGHVVRGNHFGRYDPGLLGGNDNLNAIFVNGTADGVHIGGIDPADRNSIAGHPDPAAGNGYGIHLGGSGDGHLVIGNLIGTYPDGNRAHGHRIGLRVATNLGVVLKNLISGNGDGLQVYGSDNLVVGNRIGTKAFAICLPPCSPDYALPNTHGVMVYADANDNAFNDNQVAYNGYSGVILQPGAAGNRFSGNRMHANGVFDLDLRDPSGMNPIDYDGPPIPPGPCAQANCDQNFPVLDAAWGTRRAGRVTGSLSSWNGVHRIEFFAGPACGAGGQGGAARYLGHHDIEVTGATMLPPHNGTVLFELPIGSTSSLQGQVITATATSPAGNTSEYSACVPYACDQIFAHGFDDAQAETCPAP